MVGCSPAGFQITPCLPKLSSVWGGNKTEKLLCCDKGSLIKVKGVYARTRRGIYLRLPISSQMSREAGPQHLMTNWEDKCHNKYCPCILFLFPQVLLLFTTFWSPWVSCLIWVPVQCSLLALGVRGVWRESLDTASAAQQ